MELKVKAVEPGESKSVQEVEKELLEKHEEKFEDGKSSAEVERVDTSNESTTTTQEQESVQSKDEAQETTPSSELSEEDVLSYIGKRYGKKIESFDELMQERETAEELPEDVASYFKFKKETGRSIQDYVALQKDYNDVDPDSLLRDYFKATEEGLDDDDISVLMEDYHISDDLEESEAKKLKIKKKKIIGKAKKYFTDMQEKYKQPLESSEPAPSSVSEKEIEAYNQYLADAKSRSDLAKRKSEVYQEQTSNFFNPEFKGFEFKVGEKELMYNPGSFAELKNAHLNPSKWTEQFTDESGVLNNAKGYHTALALAMNPQKFAEFFYEQGKSDATEDVTKKMKNINMTTRSTPEVTSKGGTKFKSLNADSGRGLRIRSIKKSK